MNVVQILCDTFRRDRLSGYGNPWIRTPHLDRFVREAVTFARADVKIAGGKAVPRNGD